MTQSKLRISKTDRLLEILGIAGMLILIALPLIFYDKLPDTIPIHFDLAGNPDSYGDRNSIWMLPAIGFFLFITIIFIPKLLVSFDNTNLEDPVKRDSLKKATRMLRIINMLTAFMFSAIVYHTILLSIDKPAGLWGYSTLFFLILISVVIVGFLISIKKKKDYS